MIIGPVFSREVVTVPRRARLYVTCAGYVAGLLILVCTAWLILAGTQLIRNVGDMARFGAMLFQILAPLQLALAIFFSALLAASGVTQEKDRRTLVLLLLTNLTNSELVLGKLLASMLNVLVLMAASLPLFMLTALFGGVSHQQIARVFAVTLATVLAAGSIGSIPGIMARKDVSDIGADGAGAGVLVGRRRSDCRTVLWVTRWLGISKEAWAAGLSPWQAILMATRPLVESQHPLPIVGNPINLFLLVAAALAIGLNLIAILLVRVWNPSREDSRENRRGGRAGEHLGTDRRGGGRSTYSAKPNEFIPRAEKLAAVWDNPVLWREIATWAYGRKVLVIRLVYLILAGLAAYALWSLIHGPEGLSTTVGRAHPRSAVRPEPGAGQRPGRHVADRRARPEGD